MTRKNIKIELCSPTDREKLVATVMVDGEQWVELNQESEDLMVEFYSRTNGKPWSLTYEECIEILLKAKELLINR